MHTYDSLRRQRPQCVGTETIPLKSIPLRLLPDDDLSMVFPDYQRDHVWTDEQASRFVGFLLEGGTPPVIFCQRWQYTLLPDEVVDGKQRLTAVCRWLNNEIPAIFAQGAPMYLRDFSKEDQRMLLGPSGPSLTIQFVAYRTRAEVLAFYLRLNTSTVAHSKSELDRVEGLLAAEEGRS